MNVFKTIIALSLSISLVACNKPHLKVEMSTNDEVAMRKTIELSLINNSANNYNLLVNNYDTITLSEDYSMFYKIYDGYFKEIDKDETIRLDGEFFGSDEYYLLEQQHKDSLTHNKRFVLKANDTLRFSLYIKKRYYDTPSSYSFYPINRESKFYIAFFIKNISNGTEKLGVLQSKYYPLSI